MSSSPTAVLAQAFVTLVSESNAINAQIAANASAQTSLSAQATALAAQLAAIKTELQAIMSQNQSFIIVPSPQLGPGALVSEFPSGILPSLTIATIPDFNGGSGALVENLSAFVTGTYVSLALVIVSGALAGTGWSFSSPNASFAPLPGTPPSVSVQLVASNGIVNVVSNTFTLSSTPSVSSDTTAPATPLALSVSLNALNQPVITWLASADTPAPGQAWSGMKNYPLSKGASVIATPTSLTKGTQFVMSASDLGSPAIPGSTAQTGTTLVMTGGGPDYYNAADSGQLYGGQITGDFIAGCIVAGLTGPQEFSKAGIDCRAFIGPTGTNGPGSPHVAAVATPPTTGGGFQMNSRAAQGGATSEVAFTAGNYATPLWLILKRVGNVFTMYTSVDGITLTSLGSVTNALPATVFLGFFCSAVSATGTANATFQQCFVSQDSAYSYTDTNVTQTANAQTIQYSVQAQDLALNTSAASRQVSITVPALGVVIPAGFGVRVGTGNQSGKFVSTLDGSLWLFQGSAYIGPEEVANSGNGNGGPMKGWSLVTAAELQAAIAYGVNTLPTAGKSYGQINLIRIPFNSALYMGYTGRDPFGNFGTAPAYYHVGTDSNGHPIYSGGPGGGLGSGPGHETNGDPSAYRANMAAAIAHINAAGCIAMIDLHWSTTTLNSTGQYVLPAGQMPLPGPGDVACWAQIANDYKNNLGVIFELFNEPYGTNTDDLTTEAAYLGSQSVVPFQFPSSAASPNNPTGSYLGINNLGGSANTAPIFSGVDPQNGGGRVICLACGYQQIINAIRATGAQNVIVAGSMNYDENPQSWSQAGGHMVLTDPINQLGVAYHGYSSTADSVFNTLQAAGLPILCTEMGSLAPSGGYVRWRAAGRGWTWWTWGNYATSPNPNTDPYPVGVMTTGAFSNSVGGTAWQRNGSPAPTGSN